MSWFRRLANVFRGARVRRDIEREFSFHLSERADQLRAEGANDDEARRQARRRFGGLTPYVEETRDADVAVRVEALFRHMRYGTRSLLRTPGFAATVVLTLALGTGANTAVFSAINTVLLRPLPFPSAERLVQITQTQERSSESNIAPVRLEEWNAQNSTLEGITGYLTEDVSDTSADIPERVRRASVARRFFNVWGTMPAMGRGFVDADHEPGAPSAVVVSDRYWRSRLNADPNVLRQQIRIGAASFAIVGVMPASFRFPDRNVDMWFPRIYDQVIAGRRNTWYIGIGRLKPGVTIDQARADLGVVQARLATQYPDTDREIGARIMPLKEVIVAGAGDSLWLLFGAVSLLLLISCINIASLLLSRSAHREREVAVRLSIGASRASVMAQVLIETAILAVGGTLLGLLVGAAGSAAFRRLAPDMPRIDEIALDGRILLYTLASMAAVTFLCGVMPAIRSTRTRLAGTLAETSRTQIAGRQRLQWVLVGIQVALSVTLLAGAGLLVRSFGELSRVDLGFESRRVLAFRVSAGWAETGNMPRLRQQLDRVLDGLRTVPGVEAAATSVMPPGVPDMYEQEFQLVEQPDADRKRISSPTAAVSPSYFETMQLPLVAGEICRPPLEGSAPELMVNRSFADRYAGGSLAVGRHLIVGNVAPRPARIMGVVGDAREHGINREPTPTVYFCGNPAQPFRVFLIRTRDEPTAVAQAVRLKIKELEPQRSVYDMAPLEEWIGDAFAENRLRALLLATFAITALALACIGLYGTLSYVVSLRRREVGLRLALGASRPDIVLHYLLKGLRIIAPACAAGLILAAASGRFISGMLYGVSAYDPGTLAAVLVIVFVVATLASLLPATRAAAVEPVRVLREE